jgi:hypothetical protein
LETVACRDKRLLDGLYNEQALSLHAASFDLTMVLTDLGRKINDAFAQLQRAPVVDDKVYHI